MLLVLPVRTWFLFGYSGFFLQFRNIHVVLINDSKSAVGLSVTVTVSLSLCVNPDWRPVQVTAQLLPSDS